MAKPTEKNPVKAVKTARAAKAGSAAKTSKTAGAVKSARHAAAASLRDEVLTLKRDRILYEAANLFFERGYLQTSVDAIAETLGATKPFVYYHFASKADLLVEICERGTSDALAATEQAMTGKATALQRYETFVREFTRVALQNHVLVAIYFREEFNLPEEAAGRIWAMRKLIHRKLQNLLAEGAESGEFDIDDPGLSALVIAGMSSYAFAWYTGKGQLTREKVTEHIVRLALKLVQKTVPA